jgi:radical SAM protein with 4Fe4S-binding SPASM domain
MPEYCDANELDELRRKLLWRGPSPTADRSLSVFMDQNNKCNLRCQMCGFSDPRVATLAKYDLPRWAYDRIAAELFPHANYVCLSILTEPFMTRDFPERLTALREYDVPFSDVITNGTLMSEEAIAMILDSQLTRLIVSIDGGTKEIFEAVRIGANFERVIANFTLLRTRRRERGATLPRLRVNHVLSELNIDHFDAFLSVMESLEAEEVAVRTVSRMSEAAIQESSDPVFWEKVRSARVKLAAFCERTGIVDAAFLRDRHSMIDLFTDTGEKLICRTPWTTIAVHPNGDVYPCMAWSRPPIGNLTTQSFDDIWNSAAFNALRDEFERVQPGLDCLNCTIRRSVNDPDDDFFYRKLAVPPVTRSNGERRSGVPTAYVEAVRS